MCRFVAISFAPFHLNLRIVSFECMIFMVLSLFIKVHGWVVKVLGWVEVREPSI